MPGETSAEVLEGSTSPFRLWARERHPSNARRLVAIVLMRLVGRRVLRRYLGQVLTTVAAAA